MVDLLIGGKPVARGLSLGELSVWAIDEVLPGSEIPPASALDYFGDVRWAVEFGRFQDWWKLILNADFSDMSAVSRPTTLVPEQGRNGMTVARIQVRGVLMKGWPLFGGTSTYQLRRDIRQATADPNVSGILLEVDSPGGSVAGTSGLAAEIKKARSKKPVYAQIEDMGASAAYWAASQAEQVFVNDKTTLVGSIGTFMTKYDYSAQAKNQGIEAVVFRTGPLKGAAMSEGAPISEAERNYFQSLVEDSQASFDAAVRSGRGMNAAQLAAVRSGAVFTAQQALDLKLIDGIRSTDRTLEALAQAK